MHRDEDDKHEDIIWMRKQPAFLTRQAASPACRSFPTRRRLCATDMQLDSHAPFRTSSTGTHRRALPRKYLLSLSLCPFYHSINHEGRGLYCGSVVRLWTEPALNLEKCLLPPTYISFPPMVDAMKKLL